MRTNLVLPLAGVLLLVAVSGCINTSVFQGNRPEAAMNNIPEIQEYIEEHPDYDLSVTLRSEGYIRGRIEYMSDKCGPYFKVTDYWEVQLMDPKSRTNVTVWLEKDSNQLGCLYGEGVDSPPAYIPGPEKTELLITGFSNLLVDDESTEFSNGRLYLTIGNPNAERITVKRVTVSYMDDVIKDITNSGMLSIGDSVSYDLNFSKTIGEGDSFWMDVEVLYDINDGNINNQKSKGAIISGLDTNRVIQCGGASFSVERYNFFVGTRMFNVNFRNTGSLDLQIKSYLRQGGELMEFGEPFTLWYGESKTVEYQGLTRLAESVIFISDACLGAQEVVFVEDIPGV